MPVRGSGCCALCSVAVLVSYQQLAVAVPVPVVSHRVADSPCPGRTADLMPADHANIDSLIRSPRNKTLPANHPAIDVWVQFLAQPSYAPYRCVAWRGVAWRGVAWRGVAWRMARTAFVVAVAVRVRRAMNARRTEVPAAATRANGGSATVKYWHPNITASYKANVSAPSAHPPVHANFTGAQLCWAVRCGAVRCGAVRCGAVRCGAVWCGVVWCAVRRGSMHLCVRVCGGPNRDCWMDAQTSCRRTTRISTA